MRRTMAFNHENLQVYQRTLLFNAKVGIWTGRWDGNMPSVTSCCAPREAYWRTPPWPAQRIPR